MKREPIARLPALLAFALYLMTTTACPSLSAIAPVNYPIAADQTAISTEQFDVKISRAKLLARQGQTDAAIREIDAILPQIREKGSQQQLMDLLNLRGSLLIPLPYSVEEGSMATNKTVRSLRILAPDKGKSSLVEALEIARREDDRVMTASILNNLGTLYWTRKQFADATPQFLESVHLARKTSNNVLLASALANQGRLYVSTGSAAEAEKSLDESSRIWYGQPDSVEKGEALISIGQSFRRLAGISGKDRSEFRKRSVGILAEAARSAGAISDSRLISYAVGYQGGLAEESGDTDRALSLTRQALFHAQTINSPELLCLWQWQLGRVLGAAGDKEAATSAYRMAVRSLQTIRRSIKPEASYSALSFKEMVEPVYLGFIEILLNRGRASEDPSERERLLREVLATVENLRTEELQDYFKDSCLGDLNRGRGTGVSPGRTAAVYLISMPKRLEILISLPSGTRHITSDVSAEELGIQARGFAKLLASASDRYLTNAAKLYEMIIRPIEGELKREKIEHLVFVPDGILRTVPMAALHDGEEFLISRYTISTTQGLQLVNPAPRTFTENREILMAGISESVSGFPALPSVRDELKGIQTVFSGKTLLNESFVKDSLKNEFEQKPYSYVHLATHGEFAGDIQNMFILAWDGLITFDHFNRFIRPTKYRDEPIELLTLSACKTAAGDDRAALGLAGIAVKAGAKSTVATLWEIDDEVTSELVQEFYRNLKEPTTSKAAALQKAQLKVMQNHSHPFYWAPFLLIGNWL